MPVVPSLAFATARAVDSADSGQMKAASNDIPDSVSANEVRLVGRLAAVGTVKVLPSGDELRPFRVVVHRPRGRAGGGPRKVDAIDCHALRAPVRRRLETIEPGAVVEVRGALRRRFFRGAAGLGSRYEVEATVVRRIRDVAVG
jgi:single-strand DNA-binding protein